MFFTQTSVMPGFSLKFFSAGRGASPMLGFSFMSKARKKGRKEERKEGRKEGRKEARKEGSQEARKQGSKEAMQGSKEGRNEGF